MIALIIFLSLVFYPLVRRFWKVDAKMVTIVWVIVLIAEVAFYIFWDTKKSGIQDEDIEYLTEQFQGEGLPGEGFSIEAIKYKYMQEGLRGNPIQQRIYLLKLSSEACISFGNKMKTHEDFRALPMQPEELAKLRAHVVHNFLDVPGLVDREEIENNQEEIFVLPKPELQVLLQDGYYLFAEQTDYQTKTQAYNLYSRRLIVLNMKECWLMFAYQTSKF